MDGQKWSKNCTIVLVSPSVSTHMGGEALKALHILEGLTQLGWNVIQVTHERVRHDMNARNMNSKFVYIKDDLCHWFLYNAKLNFLFNIWTSRCLHRQAVKSAIENKADIIHFTSPISPAWPYFPIKDYPVVIGAINGNILHPPAFRSRNLKFKSIGSYFIKPLQKMNNFFFRGKLTATLLVAGGERTVQALKAGGCRDDQMVFTLDSGVDDILTALPRRPHAGRNTKFVFIGRLVKYKGADLAIEAIGRTENCSLDIIGDGPERERLVKLANELGVGNRVRFLGWIPAGELLFQALVPYRALVFPTLAEANGIVVQEAMMLGLPVIALNWGGPALLLGPTTGILIEPEGSEFVIAKIAESMCKLAEDGKFAESLAIAARSEAERSGFAWSALLREWQNFYYHAIARARGTSKPTHDSGDNAGATSPVGQSPT